MKIKINFKSKNVCSQREDSLINQQPSTSFKYTRNLLKTIRQLVEYFRICANLFYVPGVFGDPFKQRKFGGL
jgi:hypothetical protein